MSTYSTQFYNGWAPASGTYYTVPAGFVVVVRDLELCDTTGAAHIVQLAIQDPSGSFALIFNGQVPASGHVQWTGRAVAKATQLLTCSAAAANAITLHAAGYLLTA